MMLEKTKISEELEYQGFEVADENTKTIRYYHADADVSVYIKVQNKRQPLIIHPENQSRFSQLAGIPGVESTAPMKFYHNSTMRAFPDRTNEGDEPTKYGIAFDFDSTLALRQFLSQLLKSTVSSLIFELQEIETSNISSSEKQMLVNARVGQGKFRRDLMSAFNGKCPITGIMLPELLRASHIQPWRDCSNDSDRLNPNNGILLASNGDALFDSGFISFTDEGRILVSSMINDRDLKKMGLSNEIQFDLVSDQRRVFMDYHRKWAFKQ